MIRIVPARVRVDIGKDLRESVAISKCCIHVSQELKVNVGCTGRDKFGNTSLIFLGRLSVWFSRSMGRIDDDVELDQRAQLYSESTWFRKVIMEGYTHESMTVSQPEQSSCGSTKRGKMTPEGSVAQTDTIKGTKSNRECIRIVDRSSPVVAICVVSKRGSRWHW